MLLVRVTSWCLRIVCVAASLGTASADPNGRTPEHLNFDIPAQMLMTALDAYSRVSGRELFYDGALTIDRQSNAVRGVLSPDTALSNLLAGTGLVARIAGSGSVTIEPSPEGFVAASVAAGSGSFEPYFANVQAAIVRVLCAGETTGWARSDTIVRLWVGASGAVTRVRAVGADGPAALGAYEKALRGLMVGVPPPTIPQPILLAVLSHRREQPNGCDDSVR